MPSLMKNELLAILLVFAVGFGAGTGLSYLLGRSREKAYVERAEELQKEAEKHRAAVKQALIASDLHAAEAKYYRDLSLDLRRQYEAVTKHHAPIYARIDNAGRSELRHLVDSVRTAILGERTRYRMLLDEPTPVDTSWTDDGQ